MREELSPSRKKESIIALFLYVASDKLQDEYAPQVLSKSSYLS